MRRVIPFLLVDQYAWRWRCIEVLNRAFFSSRIVYKSANGKRGRVDTSVGAISKFLISMNSSFDVALDNMPHWWRAPRQVHSNGLPNQRISNPLPNPPNSNTSLFPRPDRTVRKSPRSAPVTPLLALTFPALTGLLPLSSLRAKIWSPRKCVSFPFWWFSRILICTRCARSTGIFGCRAARAGAGGALGLRLLKGRRGVGRGRVGVSCCV